MASRRVRFSGKQSTNTEIRGKSGRTRAVSNTKWRGNDTPRRREREKGAGRRGGRRDEERLQPEAGVRDRGERAPGQKERSLLNLSVVIRGRNRGRGDKFHREHRPLLRTSARGTLAGLVGGEWLARWPATEQLSLLSPLPPLPRPPRLVSSPSFARRDPA